MGNLYPSSTHPPPTPPPTNQGWENCAFWLLRGMGFAVQVILSKIVGTSDTKSLNNVDETFSMVFSFVCFLVIY